MSMGKTLTVLLTAEAEAREVVEKAEKEARELREQTQKEAQEIIEAAKQQEEQETQQVVKEARSQVLATKDEILDRSEKAAQHWEELFQQNHDRVVEFIMNRILDV